MPPDEVPAIRSKKSRPDFLRASPLKSRQDRGGKDPADAASINRKDAKTPIFRPSLWNAAVRIAPAERGSPG